MIQIKRGVEANRLNSVPAEGELIYTTDDKKIYIGDGTTTGGVSIDLTYQEILAILSGHSGSGSGLNSDKLDGLHGSSYLRRTTPETLVYNDATPDSNYKGLNIDHNISGTDSLTSDRDHIALNIDVDSSVESGTTTDEHKVIAANIDVRVTGDSDLVTGLSTSIKALHTSGKITNLKGSETVVMNQGECSNVFGNEVLIYNDNAESKATSMYGGYYKTSNKGDGISASTRAVGVYSEIEHNTDTLNNAYAFQGKIDQNSGTISHAYLFHGVYEGTLPANSYGVYIASDVKNYFKGDIESDGDITATKVTAELHGDGANITNVPDKIKFNEVFTATGGETTITIPNSKTYVVGTHELLVVVNGSFKYLTDDYTEDSTTTITFTTALSAGEKVMLRLV